jgi:hypothetical protein
MLESTQGPGRASRSASTAGTLSQPGLEPGRRQGRISVDSNHDDHEHWTEWIDGSFDPDKFDLAGTDSQLLEAFAWTTRQLRSVH